jgi:hypothetical protein
MTREERPWQKYQRQLENAHCYQQGYEQAVRDVMSHLKVTT